MRRRSIKNQIEEQKTKTRAVSIDPVLHSGSKASDAALRPETAKSRGEGDKQKQKPVR
jgi:hypothetical protein